MKEKESSFVELADEFRFKIGYVFTNNTEDDVTDEVIEFIYGRLERIKQIVIEDVPHQYQKKLLEALK